MRLLSTAFSGRPICFVIFTVLLFSAPALSIDHANLTFYQGPLLILVGATRITVYLAGHRVHECSRQTTATYVAIADIITAMPPNSNTSFAAVVIVTVAIFY